jgi:uridine kinase
LTERGGAYAALGRAIAKLLGELEAPLVVCVAGESGAGKTTLALAIRDQLAGDARVLHQDDYFVRPPKANDAHRRATKLASVGPDEVDLARLADDARAFLGGAPSIEVPQTEREWDSFSTRAVPLDGVDALFIEGTYVCTLDVPAVRIFIDRDFRATRAGREARARDVFDEHTEPILEIEHGFIRPQLEEAHLVVDGDLGLAIRQWPPRPGSPKSVTP